MDPLRGFVLAKDPTCVFLVPRCAAGLFAFTVAVCSWKTKMIPAKTPDSINHFLYFQCNNLITATGVVPGVAGNSTCFNLLKQNRKKRKS